MARLSRRAGGPARCLGIILLGALALLALSCSYLMDDPYGSVGQRAVAIADIATAVTSATGSSIQYINRMYYLSSGGHTYLFLLLTTEDDVSWLIALDGGTLSTVSAMEPYYAGTGSNMAVDLSGNFALGSSSPLVLDTSLASVSSYSLSALGSVAYCLFSDGSYNNSLAVSSTELSFTQYDSDWAATGNSDAKTVDSSGASYTLLDAANASGTVLLLFDVSGQAIEVAYPSAGSLYTTLEATSYIIDSASSSKVSPVASYENSMAWATSAGLVVGSSGNNGIDLSLYKLGGNGKASTYKLKSNGSTQLYFEPSGNYFFYFDRSSGRLYKLRTWW